MTRVTAGCVCGDFLDDLPGSLVECLDVLSAFQERHAGPGHGPCDVETARRARARAKRESREGAVT